MLGVVCDLYVLVCLFETDRDSDTDTPYNDRGSIRMTVC